MIALLVSSIFVFMKVTPTPFRYWIKRAFLLEIIRSPYGPLIVGIPAGAPTGIPTG
jgi:hypothetical protein